MSEQNGSIGSEVVVGGVHLQNLAPQVTRDRLRDILFNDEVLGDVFEFISDVKVQRPVNQEGNLVSWGNAKCIGKDGGGRTAIENAELAAERLIEAWDGEILNRRTVTVVKQTKRATDSRR